MDNDGLLGQVALRIEQITAGAIPDPLVLQPDAGDDERRLAKALDRLVGFVDEVNRFVLPLSRGELESVTFAPDNYLASPLRELLSRLRHLTWQAQQIAKGDYAQRVEFMGEFSVAFNTMVESLERYRAELTAKIAQLEQALAQVKQLTGLLPICASCKRIRRDGSDGTMAAHWEQIEEYLLERTDARFTHGLCPLCAEALFPGLRAGAGGRSE